MEFEKALQRATIKWSKDLKSKVKSLAPKHIRPHVNTTATTGETRNQIVISVKPVEKVTSNGAISNRGSMDAYAQEYGANPHAILPRNKKFLSFEWDVLQGRVSRKNPKGKVILRHVMHPGHMAFNDGKGYIRPAVAMWRAELRKETPEIRKAIFVDLRRNFAKKGLFSK